MGDFVCAPFEGFVDQQEQIWKFKRGLGILPDITAVMMGWDSRPGRKRPSSGRRTPRRNSATSACGPRRLWTAGPDKNTVIFCCWNEFGEGHYIEPTRGYGFSYLDVIRDVFTEGPKEHLDIAPEDVGMSPCDSWYREARQAAANEPAAAGLLVRQAALGLEFDDGSWGREARSRRPLRPDYLRRPGLLAQRLCVCGPAAMRGSWSRCG